MLGPLCAEVKLKLSRCFKLEFLCSLGPLSDFIGLFVAEISDRTLTTNETSLFNKNVYLISQNSNADMVVRPQMEGRLKSMAFDSSAANTSVAGGQIKVKSEVLMQFEITP